MAVGRRRGETASWAAGKKTGLLWVGSAWAVAAQRKTRSRALWVMVACLAIRAKQPSARRKGGCKGVKGQSCKGVKGQRRRHQQGRAPTKPASSKSSTSFYPKKATALGVECPRPLAIAPPVLDNETYHCRYKGFKDFFLECRIKWADACTEGSAIVHSRWGAEDQASNLSARFCRSKIAAGNRCWEKHMVRPRTSMSCMP